jgi:aminoglycoside 3-N-acetyltransferase
MNKYDYSLPSIVNALQRVGITRGSSIFVHSNLGFFGLLQNAIEPFDYYTIFKEAIFDVIGDTGTLVFPTFSYSFCKKEIFDAKNTPGVCGLLSECARLDEHAQRYNDANFSVVALGKNADLFTYDATEYSFGPGSFWDRFLKKNGVFCNFNFDAGSTFIHYVERELSVDYRFDKAFCGVIRSGAVLQERVFYHFCYDLTKPEHGPEFSKFDRKAKSIGLARVANLGRGQIVAISALDTFELIRRELALDGNFLTKGWM